MNLFIINMYLYVYIYIYTIIRVCFRVTFLNTKARMVSNIDESSFIIVQRNEEPAYRYILQKKVIKAIKKKFRIISYKRHNNQKYSAI